jgi:hypothetical protein
MRAAAFTMLALCAAASAATAQVGSRLWRAEERIILTDFRMIRGVAVSDAGLFAATDHGVIIYDTRSRRWLPPLTTTDGFPSVPIRSALADPADHSAWFGTDMGVIHYLPILRQLETVDLGAPAERLAFDASDPFRGLYVRAGGQWLFLPRSAAVAMPEPSPPAPADRIEGMTVRQALAREPAAQAFSGLPLMDGRLRRYSFTSVGEDEIHRMLYFGTNGGGLIRYDPATTEFTSLPFGLLSASVGAVVATPEGIIVGTGPDAERVGFTQIGYSYQYVEWMEGAVGRGLRFSDVRDLVVWEGGPWAATDAGVLAIGREGDFLVDGLPSRDAMRLVPSPVGLWVGTSGGLARITPDGVVAHAHEQETPISALAVAFDSLWVGTPTGLAAAPFEDPIPQLVAGPPALAGAEVHDLVARNDTLVAAFEDRIAWRTTGTSWQPERSLAAELGAITAMTLDSGRVWIGGANGLAYFEFGTRQLRVVAASTDLPGGIVDIDVGDEVIWVGTTGGVVRFERTALQ